MSEADKFSPGDLAKRAPEQSAATVTAYEKRAQESEKLLTPSQLKKSFPHLAQKKTETADVPKEKVGKIQTAEPSRGGAGSNYQGDLSLPKELTAQQQKRWDERIEQTPKTLSPSELKNNLNYALSDKAKIVTSAADKFVSKKVPIDKKEAVGDAIAKRVAEREKMQTLPVVLIYDHEAPSKDQKEKPQPSITRDADRSR